MTGNGVPDRASDADAEIADAERELAAARARLARQQARPDGPHPHTLRWLARAERRVEAARGAIGSGGALLDGWADSEVRTLVHGYALALPQAAWSTGEADTLIADVAARLPHRTRVAIEHRLGWVSAVLEEEAITPLSGFPPRPGYTDLLRRIVVELIVSPLRPARGKYARLTEWLRTRPAREFDATFAEVEAVLGFPLPPSSRRHVVHWHSADGSAVVRAIHAAGWRARRVDLTNERLTFQPEP